MKLLYGILFSLVSVASISAMDKEKGVRFKEQPKYLNEQDKKTLLDCFTWAKKILMSTKVENPIKIHGMFMQPIQDILSREQVNRTALEEVQRYVDELLVMLNGRDVNKQYTIERFPGMPEQATLKQIIDDVLGDCISKLKRRLHEVSK